MTHKIFIIAGEASGDFIGAHLLRALKKTGEPFSFKGVGGDLMLEEGQEQVFPMKDLALMGIFENLSKTYGLYKKMRFLRDQILKEKPDLLITIDFPGFNFRLGKMLQGSGIRHMHYVGPTVWAWRPWRAKAISKFLSHLCVLFPFEPPYFERHGLPTSFVGHPLLEQPLRDGDGALFRKKHGIPEDHELLLILPGSRSGELAHLLPVFQETTRKLKAMGRKVHGVIPTLPHLRHKIPEAGWGIPVTITVDEKKHAYAAAKGALAASGTIALELALARVPMVIAYKAPALTIWVVRRLVKVAHACMVNLLLKKEVVPEYLQERCTPDLLLKGVLDLLDQSPTQQYEAFDQVHDLLHPKGRLPSEEAAHVVQTLLRENP